MKRAAKFFIAVYCALLICFMGGITAFAVTWDIDHSFHVVTIDKAKAPENTAFADVLIKDKWHDKYAVDFNEENGKLLGVGKDCGLAKYEDNGYTSLLLRHNCAVFDYSFQDSIFYSLIREQLYDRYRKVKVAYCDKDGNILGVTDEIKVPRASYDKAVYSFEADGKSLSCSVSEVKELHLGISFLVFMLLLIAVLFFLIFRRRRIWAEKAAAKKMIKRIQSGETDNERKER